MNTTQMNKAFSRSLAVALGLAVTTFFQLPLEAGDRAPRSEASKASVTRGAAARATGSSSRSSPGSSGRASATRPSSGSSSSGVSTRVAGHSSRGRGGSYRGHNRGRYYGGHFGFGYGYGYGYHHYYPHYLYYPWGWGWYAAAYPSYADGGALGALDLDVRPEKAQVFVDGNYVGVADRFDGFPGFLWLEAGTYDVVIYRPGFETMSRQYTIYPGMVIDVEDRMVPGESIPPEEIIKPKTSVRREERMRRDRERRAEARIEARDYDARAEPGQLRVEVEPSDASVYLDGRFLGTAVELAELRSALIVDPGEHTLEVVRPGYESQEVEFSVDAGEEAAISLALESE